MKTICWKPPFTLPITTVFLLCVHIIWFIVSNVQICWKQTRAKSTIGYHTAKTIECDYKCISYNLCWFFLYVRTSRPATHWTNVDDDYIHCIRFYCFYIIWCKICFKYITRFFITFYETNMPASDNFVQKMW